MLGCFLYFIGMRQLPAKAKYCECEGACSEYQVTWRHHARRMQWRCRESFRQKAPSFPMRVSVVTQSVHGRYKGLVALRAYFTLHTSHFTLTSTFDLLPSNFITEWSDGTIHFETHHMRSHCGGPFHGGHRTVNTGEDPLVEL